VLGVELVYARVSTAKQDPTARSTHWPPLGSRPRRIYLDKKSGVTTDRLPKSSAA